MPYIIQKRRGAPPLTSGELSHALTCVLVDYLNRSEQTYRTYNDILGALEGAKLEFYRRVMAPYEDKKCAENGDVY